MPQLPREAFERYDETPDEEFYRTPRCPAQGGVLRRATGTFRLADDVTLKGQERLARNALT
jgi:hypothetical protein